MVSNDEPATLFFIISEWILYHFAVGNMPKIGDIAFEVFSFLFCKRVCDFFSRLFLAEGFSYKRFYPVGRNGTSFGPDRTRFKTSLRRFFHFWPQPGSSAREYNVKMKRII